MKRAMNWLLAASLGAGGLALAGCDRDNANTTSNTGNSGTATDQNIRNKDDAAKVAGSQIPGDQIGVMDLNNIYKTLGDTSEAALSKGSFDDMVERFVEADRKRIGDFKDMKFDDLDAKVDAFRSAFKAKYNADFDIDDKVFENWAMVSNAGQTADKTAAHAVIPQGHGLPSVRVPLVKDAAAWRIDLPDSLTGEQLKSAVLTGLTQVGQTKAQWPADVLEAKRTVVHHVYAGLFSAK